MKYLGVNPINFFKIMEELFIRLKASLTKLGYQKPEIRLCSAHEFRFNYWRRIPAEVQLEFNLTEMELEDDDCGTLYYYVCNS